MYRETYAHVFEGDERWQAIPVPEGDRFTWEQSSTYVRRPPYFDDMPREAPEHVADITGARAIAVPGLARKF